MFLPLPSKPPDAVDVWVCDDDCFIECRNYFYFGNIKPE